MKAVVLEIKDGKAAVLKKNGEIIMIKQNELQVGDTIEIFGSTRGEGVGPIAAEGMKRLVAAAFVAAIAAGGSWTTYNTAFAASYVSLDVNPSIEFQLNRMNRVIGVSSINDDAIPIVQQLEKKSIKGKSLSQAITTTTSVLQDNDYLKEAENFILVNVSSNDENRTEILTEIVDDTLSHIDGSKHVSTNDAAGANVSSGAADTTSDIDSGTIQTDDASGTISYLINTGDLTDHQMALNLGISTGRYQEMRTVEARNSLNKVKADDTAAVDERATEIQVDKSMAQRYQDASVEDLLKGSGAISGEYKAPELKRDDGDVSIRDLDIHYETHAVPTEDETEFTPDNLSQGAAMESMPETSQGLDPLEEAAILNEELGNGGQEHSPGNGSSESANAEHAGANANTSNAGRNGFTGPGASNDGSANANTGTNTNGSLNNGANTNSDNGAVTHGSSNSSASKNSNTDTNTNGHVNSSTSANSNTGANSTTQENPVVIDNSGSASQSSGPLNGNGAGANTFGPQVPANAKSTDDIYGPAASGNNMGSGSVGITESSPADVHGNAGFGGPGQGGSGQH